MPNPHCLYNSDFSSFLNKDTDSIFGTLCDNYHGDALTTTREAWRGEIAIMKRVIAALSDRNGCIMFEYDKWSFLLIGETPILSRRRGEIRRLPCRTHMMRSQRIVMLKLKKVILCSIH